jgi:hypothetical protein
VKRCAGGPAGLFGRVDRRRTALSRLWYASAALYSGLYSWSVLEQRRAQVPPRWECVRVHALELGFVPRHCRASEFQAQFAQPLGLRYLMGPEQVGELDEVGGAIRGAPSKVRKAATAAPGMYRVLDCPSAATAARVAASCASWIR